MRDEVKTLFQFSVACATAAVCISCASSSVVGYRRQLTNDRLVVTREIKFSLGPSTASPMQHTWTIPDGVYRQVAVDDSGTYFVAPTSIHLKARLGVDLPGGLYRRGDQYFAYQEPASTDFARLYVGSKPYIWDQIPPEFAKFIQRRNGD